MTDTGNAAQVRAIADQVGSSAAEEAIRRFAMQLAAGQASAPRAEVPAPLKWAAGIVSAVLIAGAIATANWTVTTLNDLQIVVARMDERQQQDQTSARLEKIEERLSRLEQRGEK